MPSSFNINTASTDAIKRQIAQAERELEELKYSIKEITEKKEAAWATYKALPTPKPPKSRSIYDKATKQLKAASAKVVGANAKLMALRNAIDDDSIPRPKKRTRSSTQITSTRVIPESASSKAASSDKASLSSTDSSGSANGPATQNPAQPANSSGGIPPSSSSPVIQRHAHLANSGGDIPSNSPVTQSGVQATNSSGNIPPSSNSPVVQHHAAQPANSSGDIPSSSNSPVVQHHAQPANSSGDMPSSSNSPVVQHHAQPANSGGDIPSNSPVTQNHAQAMNSSGDIPPASNSLVVQHHAQPANSGGDIPSNSPVDCEMRDPGQPTDKSTTSAISGSNPDAGAVTKAGTDANSSGNPGHDATMVADDQRVAVANDAVTSKLAENTNAKPEASPGTEVERAAQTQSNSDPSQNATANVVPNDNVNKGKEKEKEKAKQTSQHWHELSEEEQKSLIKKGEKALQTYISTRGNTKISYTLRTWARREATFMPAFAVTRRSLAIECLTNLNGNLICPYHCYHDKSGAVNDYVAKESGATYQVTGVPYRRQVTAPSAAKAGGEEGKPVEGKGKRKAEPSLVPYSPMMNCGCHLEEVLLDFFMWKVTNSESITTGAIETWGENPLRPRDRTFVCAFLRSYGGLLINNMYEYDFDWISRSDETLLDLQVTRIWKDHDHATREALEDAQRQKKERKKKALREESN